MSATTTLSSEYKITLPKVVRKALHWRAGQELVFIPRGRGVLVMPAPELAQLVGIVKGVKTQGYRDRQDRF